MFKLIDIPKVSIIMPTYNRAGLIIETMRSVLDQTYQHWELIIVDDGSDDNTAEIISQLPDERIILYKAGKSGIGGRIKNIGLSKASGELYAFLDSDDIWAPTKIEKQVNILKQYPQVGFCLTGGFNFRIPFEPIEYFYKQREGVKVDNVFASFFKSELPGFVQALMLRKECIAVTGPFKEEKAFSDLDFILTLAYHFNAAIIYEPLFYRRLHHNNYIHDNWEKSYFEGIQIIDLCKARKMIDLKTTRSSLFNVYINFGEDCLIHKERKKALNHFYNAWKNKPLSITPLKKAGKVVLSFFKN